jgi:Glycosyl hydrolases family 39
MSILYIWFDIRAGATSSLRFLQSRLDHGHRCHLPEPGVPERGGYQFMRKKIVFPLLVFLFLTIASFAQSVTVDYNTNRASGSPLVFGVNDFPPDSTSHAQASALAALGVKLDRTGYVVDRIVPTTTVRAYESALAAGCPRRSVCDPSTWNFTEGYDEPPIDSIDTYGLLDIAAIAYSLPWDSSDGTKFGVPQHYDIYEDVVKKLIQHWAPAYVEVGNEPDWTGFTHFSQSQYATYYYHVAHAIRTVSSTVQIGGPVTYYADRSWVGDILNNPTIPADYVNFISWHSYPNHFTNTEGTSMVTTARTYRPSGIASFLTEWNQDSSCASSTDFDGSDSVSFFGTKLINFLADGFTGASFYTSQVNYTTGCNLWDATWTNLLKKANAIKLMSVDLGLGAGRSSIKSTTISGVTAAVGAVNSSGNPVVALTNHTESSQNIRITFLNTGLHGTVPASVFLADHGSNDAASPVATPNLITSGNSITYTINMPAYSIGGVVLKSENRRSRRSGRRGREDGVGNRSSG